jgi:hypothetical protein
MSELLDTLQHRHQECLEQLDRGDVDEQFLDQIHAFINDLRQAGASTAEPVERGQLRALLRFWGGVVYEYTGIYPTGTLLPPAAGVPRPAEPSDQRRAPTLLWLLVGGASVILIMAGLLAVGWSAFSSKIAGVATPEPPLPVVSQTGVGTGLIEEGELTAAVDSFCLDTPEIVATFALEQFHPNTQLRWELLREGETVAAQPAAPWGQETRYVTVRIQASGPDGVGPGQYDLLLYAGQHIVAMESFEILAEPPRVSGLKISDVPSAGNSPEGPLELEPGLRVVYLNYSYQGICEALELTHELYHEGELVERRTEMWNGTRRGHRQVVFQSPDSPLCFPPGSYELVVSIDGAEQGRVAFAVMESVVTVKPEPIKPVIPATFGDIVIALGVLPNGTPVLTAEDVALDANTKVVYAVFDYEGMDTGVPWSAVWMRAGEEVGRQEVFWNAEMFGMEGTHWVTYYDSNGSMLPRGAYSVTLYIDSIAQQTADFEIQSSAP